MKGNNCAICNKLIDKRSKLCHRCSTYKRYNQNFSNNKLPENNLQYRERKNPTTKPKKIYGVRRNLLFELLGNKCCICGITDKRILQFDHINGGGREEKRQFKASSTMYKYYCENPNTAKKNLQILCANCNFIKRVEKKEFLYKTVSKKRNNIRLFIFENIGKKCIECGNDDTRILQFSHKEGSMNQDLEYFKHSTSVYSYYRNNPEIARQRLIPLCPNCNILIKTVFNTKNIEAIPQS